MSWCQDQDWVPSRSRSQAVSKPVRHASIPMLCVQWKTPDYGQRNCPKHGEFHSKNKFEKLAHLVCFTSITRNFTVHCLQFLLQTMSLGILLLTAHWHTKQLSSGWPAVSHSCHKPPTLHLTDQCVISLWLTASPHIDQYSPCHVPICNTLFITNTAELHLSGLNGTASHPICRKSG